MLVTSRSVVTNAIVHITNAAVLFHLIVLLGAAGAGGSGKKTMTNAAASAQLPASKCALSEFTCNNGKCVQLNKYCDNVNDCGDSSDEPRFCTRKYGYIIRHNYPYICALCVHA